MEYNLDERKQKILKAIIQTYLETGEPVGSRTIAKYSDLKLSSVQYEPSVMLETLPLVESVISIGSGVAVSSAFTGVYTRKTAIKAKKIIIALLK